MDTYTNKNEVRGAQDGVAALEARGEVEVRVPPAFMVRRRPLRDEQRPAENFRYIHGVAPASEAIAGLEGDCNADLGRAGERVLRDGQ